MPGSGVGGGATEEKCGVKEWFCVVSGRPADRGRVLAVSPPYLYIIGRFIQDIMPDPHKQIIIDMIRRILSSTPGFFVLPVRFLGRNYRVKVIKKTDTYTIVKQRNLSI